MNRGAARQTKQVAACGSPLRSYSVRRVFRLRAPPPRAGSHHYFPLFCDLVDHGWWRTLLRGVILGQPHKTLRSVTSNGSVVNLHSLSTISWSRWPVFVDKPAMLMTKDVICDSALHETSEGQGQCLDLRNGAGNASSNNPYDPIG